jgi:hypothetical protein
MQYVTKNYMEPGGDRWVIGGELEISGAVLGAHPGQAYFVSHENGDDGNDGKSWATAFQTIQAAVDAAEAGSIIYIDNTAEYDEDVEISTNKITLVGVGAHNSVRVTGLAPDGVGVTVDGAVDVMMVNINASGRGNGAGLALMGQIRRFHAVGCRFAGGADGALIDASVGGQVVDALFERCRFEGTDGVHFTAGGGDPASQIYLKDCDFQYCSGRCLFTDGIHVTGLFVQDCSFLPEEDGSAPATKWITANFAGTTGLISGCKIAAAAHAAASIELADGVLYVGNFAEEGVSAARPD